MPIYKTVLKFPLNLQTLLTCDSSDACVVEPVGALVTAESIANTILQQQLIAKLSHEYRIVVLKTGRLLLQLISVLQNQAVATTLQRNDTSYYTFTGAYSFSGKVSRLKKFGGLMKTCRLQTRDAYLNNLSLCELLNTVLINKTFHQNMLNTTTEIRDV